VISGIRHCEEMSPFIGYKSHRKAVDAIPQPLHDEELAISLKIHIKKQALIME
jgi:hypothetical protein